MFTTVDAALAAVHADAVRRMVAGRRYSDFALALMGLNPAAVRLAVECAR